LQGFYEKNDGLERSIYCALKAQEQGAEPVLSCAEGAKNGLELRMDWAIFTHKNHYSGIR
jgi:hypothetical protein